MNAVRISISAFKDLQYFEVVVELVDTVTDIRQDLRVRGSGEAASNVGHTRQRSQESVLINNYFLIDLRNKAAEVGLLTIKLFRVRELFGLSSRLGRCSNKRRSLSRSRICLVFNNRFVSDSRRGYKYSRLSDYKGLFLYNLGFDNPAVSVLKLLIVLFFLKLNNRAKLSIIQVCSTQLFFRFRELCSKSGSFLS